MRRCLAFTAVGLAAVLAADAHAAEPAPATPAPATPAGTVGGDPATEGNTELGGQGAFGEAAVADDEAGDTLEWDLSFGALLSTGNARSTAITGGTNFLLRRDKHQFFATFLGNYGRAAPSADAEPVDTVGNLQARTRYDYFVAKRWSLFGMLTIRHDPFQLINARLNVDPGVAYYVINQKLQKLRVEVGYDFQYDDPSDAAVERGSDGEIIYTAQGETIPLDSRRTHAARLAGGYSNNMSEAVTFDTELEYLQSLLDGQRWRINWNTRLSAHLVSRLSLAATFALRMDNDPFAGAKNLDTNSSLLLVYRFL